MLINEKILLLKKNYKKFVLFLLNIIFKKRYENIGRRIKKELSKLHNNPINNKI